MSRIAVIINGNAKSVTREVLSTLDDILDSGDLFVSRSIEEGPDIARAILDRGYSTVLTGGGDGTFMHVVTQVVREAQARGVKPPRFGLLRLGTGNSLAWVVGASNAKRRGLEADLQKLKTDAGSRPLRLVEVEGVFAPFCGFGVDAHVLNDFHHVRDFFRKIPIPIQWTGGLVSYTIAAATRTIPSYVFKKTPFIRILNKGADAYHIGEGGRPMGAPILAGECIFEGKVNMASISTIPYYGFGFRVFPFADERPDRMALRLSAVGPIEFMTHIPELWRGQYQNPTTIFDYLVERIHVEMTPSMPFQIGGDACGERSEVEISLSKDPIELVDLYAPPRGRFAHK